jgi:putative ABC transport system substrate-binding protein
VAARGARAAGPLARGRGIAPTETDQFAESFRRYMRAIGWEDGRNVRYLFVWAEGRNERAPALAEQLIAQNVDLIITFGDPAIRAAQRATQVIPIVGMTDGHGRQWARSQHGAARRQHDRGQHSLSRVGRQRLEILHEFVPQARRVAVLADPNTFSNRTQLASAARDLGVELLVFEVQNPDEIGGPLDAIEAARVEAVNVLASPQLNAARHVIIERTRKARLPAIYQFPETAEEGGLLSYGPRVLLCFRHVVSLVDKVLRGTKPADLPIEQPTKFELAVSEDSNRNRCDDPANAPVARRRGDRVRRRDFITLLGGAAVAWPLAARAQQSVKPVVGYLHGGRASGFSAAQATAFRQGLGETGYDEGRNVTIEYRWAEGRYDRFPELAADLVRRNVAVIAAASTPAALAAKAATTTVPIVFQFGVDPVAAGVVNSFNRPGGNVTGIVNLSVGLIAKRLELVRQLVPQTKLIAVLLNPDDTAVTALEKDDIGNARATLGIQLEVLEASTIPGIETAFARAVDIRAGALVISSDSLFVGAPAEMATLAMRYGVASIHPHRGFVVAGGLISYGSDLLDSYRLAGIYVGRVLKGEKPAELPVQQSTKVEMAINLKTAKSLGLTMPTALLVRADEVIE